MAAITLPVLETRLQQLGQQLGTDAYRGIWPVVAQMAVSDVRKNFQGGHAPDGTQWKPLAHGRPGQSSAKPLRDKGLLLASISGQADDRGITVGSTLEYARLHQFGGVVTPKKAKFLAIPLTKEAKRRGSPRAWSNTAWRFVPTQTGGWVMMAASAANQRRQAQRQAKAALDLLEGKKTRKRKSRPAPLIAQYVLVSSVTVPARPFLGFSSGLLKRIDRLLDDRTHEIVNTVLAGNLTWNAPR